MFTSGSVCDCFSCFQGNIEYDIQDDVHDLADVRDKRMMGDIADLLTVTRDDLQKALTHRVIAAGGNVVDKGLTKSEAYYARDAFGKVTASKKYCLNLVGSLFYDVLTSALK